MTMAPLIGDGLKMIAILVFMVGGLLVVNHYVRRQLHSGSRRFGRRISVLENTHLGVKKSIAMVQVSGAVLVLGVTAERITLLERIDDPDGTQETAATPNDVRPGRSFKDHLRQLTSSFAGMSPAARPDDTP